LYNELVEFWNGNHRLWFVGVQNFPKSCRQLKMSEHDRWDFGLLTVSSALANVYPAGTTDSDVILPLNS